MKISALFKEYIWLIETINRAGRITFAEINDKWKRKEESGGMEFSRTTFNRHRDAILDMFGIIIECDRKDGYRYYIENKDVLNEDSVQNWMFSTLSVSNMLNENVAPRSLVPSFSSPLVLLFSCPLVLLFSCPLVLLSSCFLVLLFSRPHIAFFRKKHLLCGKI